jgi:3-hexulose-6-phosphate synthase
MLLQIALDKPEHLALLPHIRHIADIVEIGTPLLKRFGIATITTARELCPGTPVLADTKTVDGGQLEAEMVFGAGAVFMTVLSSTTSAPHEAVGRVAAKFRAHVIVDTITQAGKKDLLPASVTFPDSFAYVGVHRPSDAWAAGDSSTAHIDAVAEMHRRGFRVALAGGLGPDSIDSVLAFEPEIVIVGSAITESGNPQEVAKWMRNKLINPGRGWPWEKK